MNLTLNKKLVIVLKVILLLIVLTFVWFHFKITKYYENTKSYYPKSEPFVNKLIVNTSQELTRLSVKDIKQTIDSINRRQEVYNLKTFGPLLATDLVIVIQVHKRVKYLSALIESLRQTKDINQVLLVFSHDVFDPQINSLITSIRFCKIIQIFYPKSLQLNANSFPGDSPDDCPRDLSIKEALRIGCKNRFNSDTYGHFREAKFTQTKHHFWWKINVVFDLLDITRHHSGHFMFIEEDHYLSPDSLHVWKLMTKFDVDDKNQILTLGSYVRSVDFARNGQHIQRGRWISSRHNMAFIINRNIWLQIKDCAQSFCTYDDYNWDWSLQYVSENCLQSPLKTLFVSIPRVYHTGECGLHHKTSECDNKLIINTIRETFKSSQNYLFPKQLVLQKISQKAFRMPKPNGGWADPRDHELCLNYTHSYLW